MGPLQAADEALARRYRAILKSWQPISLDVEITESAARLRSSLRLRLADAVQVASALAINAAALVTYDRVFSRVRSLRIICVLEETEALTSRRIERAFRRPRLSGSPHPQSAPHLHLRAKKRGVFSVIKRQLKADLAAS